MSSGYLKQTQIKLSPEHEGLANALIIVRSENNRTNLIRNLLEEEAARQDITLEDVPHIIARGVPVPKRGKDTRPRVRKNERRSAQSSEGLPTLKRKAASHESD